MENLLEVLATLFIAIVTAIIGYHIGLWKLFREKRLGFYERALPIFLEMAYGSTPPNESELNKVQAQMWIFASTNVAMKLDKAIEAYYKKQEHCYVQAMQTAIVYMRNDIQPWWHAVLKPLRPVDIRHLSSCTHLGNKSRRDKTNNPDSTADPQQ